MWCCDRVAGGMPVEDSDDVKISGVFICIQCTEGTGDEGQ